MRGVLSKADRVMSVRHSAFKNVNQSLNKSWKEKKKIKLDHINIIDFSEKILVVWEDDWIKG